MNDLLDMSTNDLQAFLLVFFRVTGVIMLAPIFGGEAVPRRVRAMIAFVVAILVYPLVDRAGVAIAPNLGFYLSAVLLELSVGMILGFAASLVFTVAQFAGHLVDQEIGLSLANVIDPITNQQVSVIGQFKMFLGMIIWLLLSGHHFVIDATFECFRAVPLLSFTLSDAAALHIADAMMTDVFVSAFRLAAPAVVTLFLVTLAMAFMARVVPEMNIFILGFSLRIVVGLLVLLLVVGVFADMFAVQVERHEESVIELLERMKGGPENP